MHTGNDHHFGHWLIDFQSMVLEASLFLNGPAPWTMRLPSTLHSVSVLVPLVNSAHLKRFILLRCSQDQFLPPSISGGSSWFPFCKLWALKPPVTRGRMRGVRRNVHEVDKRLVVSSCWASKSGLVEFPIVGRQTGLRHWGRTGGCEPTQLELGWKGLWSQEEQRS